MRPVLKSGLLTIVVSIVLWFILEIIALSLNMHLRPKINIVIMMMFIVGILMALVSYVSSKIKNAKSKIKMALWIALEMMVIVIMTFGLFITLINMPTETEKDNRLTIEYLNTQDNYQTSDYNFIFYR